MTGNAYPPDDHEDSLEAILRSAAWPEPGEERLERLRRRWRLVSAWRRRNRVLPRATALLAIAAGLAIAVLAYRLVVLRAWQPTDSSPLAIAPLHSQQAPPPSQHPAAAVPDGQPAGRPATTPAAIARTASLASRPATEYERSILRLQTTGRHSAPPSMKTDLLEKLIAQVARHRGADLEELARPLLADRRLYEQQLAERIGRLRGSRREAAIRLLEYIGSQQPRSLPSTVAAEPATPTVALSAAARMADPMSLARWAAQERNPRLQEDLLAELLRRNDLGSLKVYLQLVQGGGPLAAPALAAAHRVEQPPVERLLACLYSPRSADRFAAAQILGQINDPQITERLIAMASYGTPCQDVLTALMYRPDQQAQQFLAQARRSPVLFSSLLAVSKRIREIPSNGMSIGTVQ